MGVESSNTKAKAQVEIEKSGNRLQLICVTWSVSKEFALAAGSERGQQAFLQVFGKISSVSVDPKPILSEEQAQLITRDDLTAMCDKRSLYRITATILLLEHC